MGSSSKEPGANCGWAEHISGFLDLPPFAAEYAGMFFFSLSVL
ncbi:unnamed protein product [Toxocara canis]|uniref:Uncharacterized protein n=1 Tax=Toxocara canis TaxID=6265 RepID=A0A183U7W0_TOXCA|nr:unnamed protein product [Toxocara canis]